MPGHLAFLITSGGGFVSGNARWFFTNEEKKKTAKGFRHAAFLPKLRQTRFIGEEREERERENLSRETIHSFAVKYVDGEIISTLLTRHV